MRVLHAVDRPWNNELLREFWRFGKLVPNPEGGHPWSLRDDHPQWVKDLQRWYHLTSDANPPQETWGDGPTILRVFTQALVLGEAPERRWLIYSHAPLGAVPAVTVTVPEFGDVLLPSVPKSGSFFLLNESDGVLEPVIVGGPEEIAMEVDRSHVRAGDAVRFTSSVAHAPERVFERFTWDFGDGTRREEASAGSVEHTYAATGNYIITVEAHAADGTTLRDQTALFVGEIPARTTVYDLPLDGAFEWEGPWDNAVDRRYDTLAFMRIRRLSLSWEIELPNGEYEVRLVAGDPNNRHDQRMAILAQDELFLEGNYSVRSWAEARGSVQVTEGRLRLANADGGARNSLCFIEITPSGADAETIRINFQPASTAPVEGYLVDAGEAFGERAEGQRYGWSESNDSAVERGGDFSGASERELLTYRHLPNRGSLPNPVLVGGRIVEDAERGRVLELDGAPQDGVYLVRAAQTNLEREGFADKTIAFSFKADAIEGRQGLYAEGTHHVGMNIYLDGDTLYAGAFAPVDGRAFSWGTVFGRNWPGEWMAHSGIEAGKWYDIALVFTDAASTAQPDRMHLHVNGERVASAPAARVPRTPMPPRLGRIHLNGHSQLLTLFHDGGDAPPTRIFRGRLSNFRLVNGADGDAESGEGDDE